MKSESNISKRDTKEIDDVNINSFSHISDDDIPQSLQSTIEDIQNHFKSMSQAILSRIDDMGAKIDQLEYMLNDIVSELDTIENNKNNNILETTTQSDSKCIDKDQTT
ncbi:heat shock factor binding protein 1, putative [Cryptosporidium muris RN66]|uniref:Heat shock factor binding protein 1, putative n=1 Tax=Cryptosporidium muris (strain RN66) TaxID=441375 RepID=B6AEU1_CRYMR|nr:heat shock factor binding protein 1, putative [Cryptosporidium muris RN66]EEA06708.1 heat shock factor binding protein 1, putative [Cryptosporidium muris RN66]|eukprot:XP_002141057.1 heat shock factor binding protein 1 [Cryptosporidium muris RN66]